MESYQSLYLKIYFPTEFMVAAINNGGGFYRTEVYVHEDPRYALDKEKRHEVHRKINEDVSMTFRRPYPSEQEINLPRMKMG